MATPKDKRHKKRNPKWKREPEISKERQEELSSCLLIFSKSEETSGLFDGPFNGMILNRADIEWLLSNHENNLGPVNPANHAERKREGLNLYGTDLHEVDLSDLPLARSFFTSANLKDSNLSSTQLTRASMIEANLEGAYIDGADLRKAGLAMAHLEGADLTLSSLGGANLYLAFFSNDTNLDHVTLSDEEYGTVFIHDLHWGDANLTVIENIGVQLRMLGEEKFARDHEDIFRTKIEDDYSIRSLAVDFGSAARANRQLATILRNQGMNEEAGYFAYKANQLQRKVYQYSPHSRSKRFLSFVFDWLAGYGYKPERAFTAYLFTVIIFGWIFFLTSPASMQLSFLDSLVLSLSNTLRIGFFPSASTLGDLLIGLSVLEGALAIFIEAVLVASFLRRFLEG